MKEGLHPELEERIVDLKGEIVDISKEVKTQDITLKHIGGEIVDISTKVKTQSEDIKILSQDRKNNTKWICERKEENETKLAKLEERISRMESFHRQQEEFYGVNRERKMLDDFLSITETRIKSLKG